MEKNTIKNYLNALLDLANLKTTKRNEFHQRHKIGAYFLTACYQLGYCEKKDGVFIWTGFMPNKMNAIAVYDIVYRNAQKGQKQKQIQENQLTLNYLNEDSAIQLLKSLGYKILKPTTKFIEL